MTTEPYTFIEIIEGSDSAVPWSAVYTADGTKLILILGTGTTIKTYDTTSIPYTLIDGVIPSTYATSSYFGQARCSALSPNGEILCITGANGWIIFDTTTLPYTVLYTQTGVGQASPPIFYPDGTKLYIIGSNAIYKNAYGVSYYVGLCTIAEDKTISFSINPTVTGLPNEATNYIMFSDDSILTAGDVGKKLSLYSVGSTSALMSVGVPGRSVEYCTMDPTGKYLISVGPSYNGLRVSEVAENCCVFHQPAEEYQLTSRNIKSSPDGKRIFIASTSTSEQLFIYRIAE